LFPDVATSIRLTVPHSECRVHFDNMARLDRLLEYSKLISALNPNERK